MEKTVIIEKMVDSAVTVEQSAMIQEKLGIVVSDITRELAAQLRTNQTKGVVVMEVKAGSLAEDAGIARGDIITQINSTAIGNSTEYAKAVATLKKGAIVRFLLHRGESTLFVAMKVE